MNRRRNIAIILTIILAVLTAGCGSSKGPRLTENMKKYGVTLSEGSQGEGIDEYNNIKDNISEYTEIMPGTVTEDNFIGYYTYEGSASYNDSYFVYKKDGSLKIEGRSFATGESKDSGGNIGDTKAFFDDLSGLEYVEYDEEDMAIGNKYYGLLIYESEGKTVATYTFNLFYKDY